MYQYAWFFYLYAFLGWCGEVAFAAVKERRFVNRGFLNSPICPIYGFGVVAVILCLQFFGDHILALYLGSVIVTSALEWATGFLLEKLFHTRWWDYSNLPLNIGGYICLPFSLLWGAVCVLIVKLIQPLFERLVDLMPSLLGWILLCVFTACFIADLCVTISTILKLNKRLESITKLTGELRNISDHVGEQISDHVLGLYKKEETLRANAQQHKTEWEEKKAQFEQQLKELLETRHPLQNRLIRAFPKLRSNRHNDPLARLKERLNKK